MKLLTASNLVMMDIDSCKYESMQTPATRHAPLYIIQQRSETESEQDAPEKKFTFLLGKSLRTTSLALGTPYREGRRLIIKSDDPRGIKLQHLLTHESHELRGCINNLDRPEKMQFETLDSIRASFSVRIGSVMRKTGKYKGKEWLTVIPLAIAEPTLIINRTMLNRLDPNLLGTEADPYFNCDGRQLVLIDKKFDNFTSLLEEVKAQIRSGRYLFLEPQSL